MNPSTAERLETIKRERAALHERWQREGWYRNETVAQTLLRVAREKPGTQFRFQTEAGLRESTTHEIVQTGARLAPAFADIGIKPGDVVAFQLPTSFDTAVLYVAAFCAGATVLPIVHFYGPADVSGILQRAKAKALIIPDRWRHVDYLERLAALTDLPDLEHLIVVGDKAPAGARRYKDLQALARDGFSPPDQDPNDIALLLFTSGTTGKPKGVQQSHTTLACEWHIPFMHHDGLFLNPTPAGHIQGFNFLIRPMVCGFPMIMMDRWDAGAAAELIARLRVKQAGGAPYFLMTLMDAAKSLGHDISSLEVFGLGGTAVTPEHVYMADRLGLMSGRSYGSSEHSTVSTYRSDASLETRATTDGQLLPGTEVKIVDDDDREVAYGTDGEILLRGPEQFPGYMDDEHNLEAFAADGWFRSGDIGRVTSDGLLTITDRKKDIIIRGGENISSLEVENILLTHDAVAEVAVVAMPDERFGERACACVVTAPGAVFDFDAMVAHCAASGFAKQKTPEKLLIFDELPRTPTGKVRKNELRDQIR